MKRPFIIWFALAQLVLTSAFGADDKAPLPKYRSELGVNYCAIDEKNLILNAFLPEDATNLVPAIVEIHGGWWHGGEAASRLEGIGGWQTFVRRGLAMFSIQYRLGSEGGFPENIRDCRNAIRFIRQNARRFNVDPDRIGVTGGSAGGHLSLMVAMVPEDFDDGGPTPGLEGVSAHVSCSFSIIPPTDFVRFWNQGPDDALTNQDGTITFRGPDDKIPYDSRPRLRVLFHGIAPDTDEHKALYTRMCPVGHVRRNVPPLLICDGEKDPIVPGLHGKALYEKLKAVGADATYWMTPDGGHGYPGGAGFDQVLDDFIERNLTGSASSAANRGPEAEKMMWRAETNSAGRPGGFQFDGKISRQVLENYLSRSICVEGLLTGRSGPLSEEIRMLTNCGAKYVARALCLWGAENNFLANVQKAREAVPRVLAADPEIVLEACVFETVGPKVSQLAIPDWVFRDLGQPVEQRNFRYEDITYPEGQRRAIGPGQVPDESRLETQLWFYYQAASYIDCGCEGIHFGQVEIMNKNDHGNTNWFHLLSLVRQYAAKHARRHMVICNGHVPTGGLMHEGNPLLDFHAFPLRIKATLDKPQEAILQVGFTDAIYNRSKGGKTFSGWTCEHLPYFVEFDNYGQSDHPGKPNPQQSDIRRSFLWIWGYDEITWFSLQPKDYRAKWLQYAWDWVRNTDANGYLEMPGGRVTRGGKSRWYYANDPNDAFPDGHGDEAAIRAVWAKDTARLMK